MKAKSTPPAFKISALLADDQEIYLTGLSRSVRNLNFVSKVCSAQNGEEVLTLLNNLTFHVVIISMHLPEIKKLHVMKEIKERFPNLKVIGFSDTADATGILSFMEEGAHGFLLKNTTRAEIREAIRTLQIVQHVHTRGTVRSYRYRGRRSATRDPKDSRWADAARWRRAPSDPRAAPPHPPRPPTPMRRRDPDRPGRASACSGRGTPTRCRCRRASRA